MTNALKSLYGAGHVAASENDHTAEVNKRRARDCVAMPGVRNQVVYTPECILAPLRAFWPDGIAYDPCHGPDSIVGAQRATSTRGLLDPWPHRTYANPPFGTSLRDPAVDGAAFAEEQRIRKSVREAYNRAPKKSEWPAGLPLKKDRQKVNLEAWCRHHIEQGEGERVMLVPNRSNREWLDEWRHCCTMLVDFRPFKFGGQRDAVPFPMVIGLVGATDARAMEFAKLYKHLGTPTRHVRILV